MKISKLRMSPYGMHKDADDDGNWITVNGTHIEVNGEGEVTKGPTGLKSSFSTKKSSSAASGKSSSTSGASKPNSTKSAAESYKQQYANALKNGAGDDELNQIIENAANDEALTNSEYTQIYGEMLDMYKNDKPLAGETSSTKSSSSKANTTDKIDPDWGDYDKAVAETHMANYGKIFLDEYGSPIDNEEEVADLAGDDFYTALNQNVTTGAGIKPTYVSGSASSKSS